MTSDIGLRWWFYWSGDWGDFWVWWVFEQRGRRQAVIAAAFTEILL